MKQLLAAKSQDPKARKWWAWIGEHNLTRYVNDGDEQYVLRIAQRKLSDDDVDELMDVIFGPQDNASTTAHTTETADNLDKGAFHRWLGKAEDSPITDADVSKGLKSKDPHVRKMAQYVKNRWNK